MVVQILAITTAAPAGWVVGGVRFLFAVDCDRLLVYLVCRIECVGEVLGVGGSGLGGGVVGMELG